MESGVMSTANRFFCLEGIDGSGKTTQLTMLQEELARRGFQSIRVREPGGTDISEKIRNILLSPVHKGKMSDLTELLLYNAARAQVISEIIQPALANGKVVLADRYAWSTLAYQGFGRGIDTRLIRTEGFGESRPLVKNSSASNRQRNRRVEVRLDS